MKIKIRLGDADLDRTLSLYYCQVTGWKPPLELSTHLPLRMFFFFGQYTKQWHLALAGLTIAIIPVILSYFFAQKPIIKGMADGAVK